MGSNPPLPLRFDPLVALMFWLYGTSTAGSWVEVEAKEPTEAVSRGESLTGPSDTSSPSLQGELERILLEAQLECERYRDRYNDHCVVCTTSGCILSLAGSRYAAR